MQKNQKHPSCILVIFLCLLSIISIPIAGADCSSELRSYFGRDDSIIPYDDNCLLKPAKLGDKTIIECLIVIENTKKNAREEGTGKTALMLSAEKGYEDIVRLLMTHGCDITLQDRDGMTALMYATVNNRLNIVRTISEKLTNIRRPDLRNAQNVAGETALIMAARLDHLLCGAELMRTGTFVDRNITNLNGETALYIGTNSRSPFLLKPFSFRIDFSLQAWP
jgi:ankyrin repeat protein